MQDQDSWSDCPTGVVSDMASQLRLRKRQAQLRPVLTAGVAVLVLLAVSYALIGGGASDAKAGLTCSETAPLLAKYHDQSLEADVANDVREHLSRCPACQKHYEDAYPSEVRNRAPKTDQLVASAWDYRR